MDNDQKQFIFNNYARLSVEDHTISLCANEPAVVLKAGRTFKRNKAQLDRLDALNLKLPDADPLFGVDLSWAYREYIVHLLSTSGDEAEQALPLGQNPPQPIVPPNRQTAKSPPAGRTPATQHLYLFNVIVALEWHPGPRYLQQLRWAFRRASDFLYDVTDGFMAFGQVVFGGPEIMNCADIQIMASNRLLPRSWVSGMHEPAKYMPIRAGRGIWHKNNRVSISWEEPEAYRTLIHEWAHYALELRDEYLELRQVAPATPAGSGDVLIDMQDTKKIVVPQISMISQSIMATIEGTSELVPRGSGDNAARRASVWEYLASRNHFPSDKPHEPLDGPGQLPLPLPRTRCLGVLEALAAAATPTKRNGATFHASDGLWFRPPDSIQPEHCWVYALRGPRNDPTGLIAQGTLDARATVDGFRLLGVEPGDSVVLIGQNSRGAQIILTNTIHGAERDRPLDDDAWQPATPDIFPLIDIIPTPLDDERPLTSVRVCVTTRGGPPPDSALVFALGDPMRRFEAKLRNAYGETWMSEPLDLPTLDGHALLRWGDKLVISAFSQGGGPNTNTPVGPPPISAGSSEGNLMLFFGDEEFARNPDAFADKKYDRVRVVTTLIHGMTETLPGAAQARSYTFSLAGTKNLPAELNPTLVMHFDTSGTRADGDLLVYRQTDQHTWIRLSTYCRPGSSFVAVALRDEDAGGALLASDSPTSCVERYRLYLLPRGAMDRGPV